MRTKNSNKQEKQIASECEVNDIDEKIQLPAGSEIGIVTYYDASRRSYRVAIDFESVEVDLGLADTATLAEELAACVEAARVDALQDQVDYENIDVGPWSADK